LIALGLGAALAATGFATREHRYVGRQGKHVVGRAEGHRGGVSRAAVLTGASCNCGLNHSQARTTPRCSGHSPCSSPILPTTPDEQPPENLGLIALTVAEIKRLFNLATRRLQPEINITTLPAITTKLSPSTRLATPLPPSVSASTTRS
jgi:hypothetical protein